MAQQRLAERGMRMKAVPGELREVSLTEMDGIALIVPWRTGVLYVAETGGPSRHRAALEGFLVPLDVGWWAGDPGGVFRSQSEIDACAWELDQELADALDHLLAEGAVATECGGLVVDRDCLSGSREGWVHVTATTKPHSQSLVQGCDPLRGVLTWRNSTRPFP